MKDAMLAEACEPVAELLRTMNALLEILEIFHESLSCDNGVLTKPSPAPNAGFLHRRYDHRRPPRTKKASVRIVLRGDVPVGLDGWTHVSRAA